MKDKKIAYLVTHPIQNQSPLLKFLSEDKDINLTVFFCSDYSIGDFKDPQFNVEIKWDVDLLDGYKYEFLPSIGSTNTVSSWRPFNYGLISRLLKGNYDVLWMHGYSRLFNILMIFAAKFFGIKVLIRDEATKVSANRGLVKRMLKVLFFSVISRVADGFLSIGTLNADYYRSYGVTENKIFNVPYVVDNNFFQKESAKALLTRESLRQDLNLEPARPIILYASKLTERKRAADLLQAVRLLYADIAVEVRPYLLIVGDGEQKEKLIEASTYFDEKFVRFIGFVNQTQLPAYYELADVFVLPSANEPWGLVVNEAMNAGIAVIVSDQVGSGPDLVKNNVNGHIFKSGDVHDLKEKLTDVLNDPIRCKSMGAESLKLISNWDFQAAKIGLKAYLRTL